jgi:hypothetical protein
LGIHADDKFIVKMRSERLPAKVETGDRPHQAANIGPKNAWRQCHCGSGGKKTPLAQPIAVMQLAAVLPLLNDKAC